MALRKNLFKTPTSPDDQPAEKAKSGKAFAYSLAFIPHNHLPTSPGLDCHIYISYHITIFKVGWEYNSNYILIKTNYL